MWIKKVQEALQKNFILETIFTAFELERRSNDKLIKKLQNCINIINNSFLNKEYNYYIDEISNDYTTEEHNRIHHHFEILIGQSWNPSDWWKIICNRNDINLINAVRGLNDLTHELESSKIKMPYLSTTFLNDDIKKEELPLEVEDYFTLETCFGDVFLHYAQLGKTWLEVVIDNDDKIYESNINPLKIISGEFDICFGDFLFLNKKINHKVFKKHLTPFFKKINKDINDKSLRLGRVLVAKIIQEEDKKTIIEKIKNNDQVFSISIIDEDKMFSENDILYREFKPYYDPY